MYCHTSLRLNPNQLLKVTQKQKERKRPKVRLKEAQKSPTGLQSSKKTFSNESTIA